jgi:diguanylate cyclase (GGDEF)-like protein
MSLGRSPTNQGPLDDPGVSRCHASWGVAEGSFFVEDLGSANGTFVGGRREPRHRLENNDILQLGPRVMLRFSLVDKHEENLMRELYRSSRIDTLTRVYNRKYLDDRLRSEFAFSQRHRQNLALILFDVDHFKSVNDRYGHAGGDAVLRQVARCCQDSLRAEDLLARVGGEEFAVLLRGVGLRGAVQLAERLRMAVEAQVTEHLGQRIQVTMSAGCATDRGSTPASLFEAADVCLYQAKRSGRNRVASPLEA